MEKNLYQEIVEAGIEHEGRNSDLYVPDTAAVREILARHKGWHVSGFMNQITKTRWLDVAFAYAPFWDNVARLSKEKDERMKKFG